MVNIYQHRKAFFDKLGRTFRLSCLQKRNAHCSEEIATGNVPFENLKVQPLSTSVTLSDHLSSGQCPPQGTDRNDRVLFGRGGLGGGVSKKILIWRDGHGDPDR
jgi:hypothetical protein